MGRPAEGRALRVVDQFEGVVDAETGHDVLRGADPRAVRGEIGQRVAAVRVQTGAQESGNGVRSLLQQFHDGDIDDYANNGD